MLFSDAGAVVDDGERALFRFEESDYEVRWLGEYLGERRGEPVALGKRVLPLMLVDTETGPCAVAVDAAVDGRYLVVKTLGEHVPRARGVIGASILGDGSVAPVLELHELMRG